MSEDKADCGCDRVERAGDWDESEHPRDPDGKFAGGGGGDGGGKKPSGGGKHPGKGYSSSAKLIGGVICTPSIYDAQRALHEGRKVELDQPRKLSVLIDRLGKVAQSMIAKGEKAPVFNLCNVNVRGSNLFCAETKGIPRAEMPQLDDQQTKDFRKYLKAKGYKIEKEKTPAANLRATQNQLIGAHVAGIAAKLRDKPGHYAKRVIVSKDDYILDGHHHWAAKVGLDAADGNLTNDTKVKISRVDISITKLLAEAEKFTGGKGKKPGDTGTSKHYTPASTVLADLYRATFDEEADEVEQWMEWLEERQAQRRQSWAIVRAEAERLLRGQFLQDPVTGKLEGSLPGPGHGEGTGSGPKDKGKEEGKEPKEAKAKRGNYGLVPGDLEKYHALKAEMGKINNEFLKEDENGIAPVDDPTGPRAAALLFQTEAVVKDMHKLKADTGGPGGMKIPGGPRDIMIIGAGPGGMNAATNAASESLDTLLVEANLVAGGQAKFSSRVENLSGYPVGVRGKKLTQDMLTGAQRMGAETILGVRATAMTVDADGMKHVTLSNGETVESRTVVIAGGVEFIRTPFAGDEGPGVVLGDPEAMVKAVPKGGTAVVIGGSNGAAQAALGAAEKAEHVYLLARSPIVNNMSAYVVSGVRGHPKITVIEGDEIVKLWRDEHGNPQTVETKKGQKVPANAVGMFIGSVPKTDWVPPEIKRNEERGPNKNKLQTKIKEKTPINFETEIPGVYVIGDMRDGGAGRIGVAMGEGQFVVRDVYRYLDEQKEEYYTELGEEYLKEKADKPPKKKKTIKKKPDIFITEHFDLDRENPWFGQFIEDVEGLVEEEPLEPAQTAKKKAFA